VFLFLSVSLAGCGDNSNSGHNPIKGEVKLNGQPMESGTIMFRPIEGGKGQAVSGTIKAGHYEIASAEGPAVGPHHVEVRGVRKTGKMIQKPLAPKGELVEEEAESVSERFNSRSDLKADIKAGDNVANFDVKSR
jgi:hypothetical protein